MLTIRAMSDGKGYSSRHLEHSDYYAEGERVVGFWSGRGADLLRLSGEVTTNDFEALRQGLDPHSSRLALWTARHLLPGFWDRGIEPRHQASILHRKERSHDLGIGR